MHKMVEATDGYCWYIIWPEKRYIKNDQLKMYYSDAVANGECVGGEKELPDMANAMSDAGLFTFAVIPPA